MRFVQYPIRGSKSAYRRKRIPTDNGTTIAQTNVPKSVRREWRPRVTARHHWGPDEERGAEGNAAAPEDATAGKGLALTPEPPAGGQYASPSPTPDSSEWKGPRGRETASCWKHRAPSF